LTQIRERLHVRLSNEIVCVGFVVNDPQRHVVKESIVTADQSFIESAVARSDGSNDIFVGLRWSDVHRFGDFHLFTPFLFLLAAQRPKPEV
jgi:hypothetical protein